MKKRVYLRSWVEYTLATILFLIIGFVAMSIDSLGNATYDKILVGCLVVGAICYWLLSKFGREVFDNE